MAAAKEGSIDPDVLQSAEIAGERIVSEDDHVRDFADLERAVSILVPGQAVAALCRHAQRLISGQPTVSELPLTVIVPAGDRLPRRPQHRIGHSVGRERNRHAAIQHAPECFQFCVGFRQVAELRLRKDSLDPAKYEQDLEKLLTELALKTKAIRDLESKK